MTEIKQIRPKRGDGAVDRRVQRTRAQILDAAAGLIRTRGLDGLTMDSVAETAGVSRSTLYRHWPQMHDLLFDTLHHIGAQIDTAATPPPGNGTAAQCIVANALAIGRVMRDDTWRALVTSLGLAAEYNTDAAAVYESSSQRCRAAIADLVEHAQANGQIDPDTDPQWLTDLVVGPIYMNAIVLHRPMTDQAISDHIDAVFALLPTPN